MQPVLFDDPRPPVGPAPEDPALIDLAAQLPPHVRLGTSSWTFPGWAGVVWDRTVPQAVLVEHGLAAYAQHPLLGCVGVDRSFWAPVPPETLQLWTSQVPEDFQFLCKAHEDLTWARFPDHARYGARRNTDNPRFLNPDYAAEAVVGPLVEHLGAQLGPMVFQLPPQPAVGDFPAALDRFLGALPSGPQYAVEIRAAALLTADYADVLHAHGAVHCLTVHPGLPDLRAQWRIARVAEGPALVLRWNLAPDLSYAPAKEAFAPFDRLQREDVDRRTQLARLLRWAEAQGRPTWLTANNKAEGSAPWTLRRVVERFAALQ